MLPSKKDIFHAALDQPRSAPSGRALVRIIPEVPGLSLGDFAQDIDKVTGHVILAFILRGKEPLDTDDAGIRAVLGRNGVPTPVFIPWAAVLAIAEETTGNAVFFNYHEPAVVDIKETVTAPPPKRGPRLVKDEEN